VENLAPTGIRSPDRPARSQSLYRLSYPAHTDALCRPQIDRHRNISSTDQDGLIIKLYWYMTPFRLVNNVDFSVSIPPSSTRQNIPEDLNLINLAVTTYNLLKKCCFYTEFESLLEPILSHFWRDCRVHISPTFPKCFCSSSS
jgi:hypothetical protein